MNAAAIRVLFDYNAWAHAQVWRCIQQLDDDQFVHETDYSLGSLRNHLVHIASVDARWFARLRGNPLPDQLKPEDFPTREDVSRLWSVIYSDLDVVLANLSDERVSMAVDYTVDGHAYRNEVWKLLLHIVHHGTDHRAQMLYTLHRMGVSTVEQDFVYYLRDELPPRGYVTVSISMMQALVQYDMYATSRLVAEGLAGLTDAQLDQDFGYAHGTVRAQLAHILVGMQYWLGRAFGVQIEGNVTGIFRAAQDLLTTVTDEQLMLPVEYKTSQGHDTANMRWEMIWQMVNHGTDHRA